MTLYRTIKDQYVYRESCISICKAVGLDMPRQVLTNAATSFAHKVVVNKKPEPIYETIKFPTQRRACQMLSSKLQVRTKRRKRGLIYRIPALYNNIPSNLKFLNTKKFKIQLKKYKISDVPID